MQRQSYGEKQGETISPKAEALGAESGPETDIVGAQESASSDAEADDAQDSRPRGYVTVFAASCKGCGICIDLCPRGVFAAGHLGAPVVRHEDRCSACGWCVTHCPDMAISVRKLSPEELQELAKLQQQAELPDPDPPRRRRVRRGRTVGRAEPCSDTELRDRGARRR